MTRTRLLNILSLLAIIAVCIGLSMLFARVSTKAQAYEPDYIDKERLANMKALQSGACYWYGVNCPRTHYYGWRWRYHLGPRPDRETKAAQERLQTLGYDVEADGLMGPQTRSALYEFQAKAGIPVTGRPDKATWDAFERYEQPSIGFVGAPPKICAHTREGATRHCGCDPVIIKTGEHVWKDGKAESMKRWKGAVRADFGELWMNWRHAVNKVEFCWGSGTGERSLDRHVRCLRSANPCWGILQSEDGDDMDDVAPPPTTRKGRDD